MDHIAETRRMLSQGNPYLKNSRFYGTFATGEWAWYDTEDAVAPWKFVGGVVSLIEMERAGLINWYTLNLSSGRRIYLPKMNDKKLIFIYDKEP
jgi:hypothetical protein